MMDEGAVPCSHLMHTVMLVWRVFHVTHIFHAHTDNFTPSLTLLVALMSVPRQR